MKSLFWSGFAVALLMALAWTAPALAQEKCGEGKVCVFLITNVDQLVFGTDAIEGNRRCQYQGGGLCGSEGGDTPITYIVYMGPFDTQHEANVDFCDKHLEGPTGVRLTQMRISKFSVDGKWHGVNHISFRCPPPEAPKPPANRPPVINSLTASDANPDVGTQVTIAANATDPDGDSLSYTWWLDGSLTSASTPSVTFTPNEPGSFSVRVEVSDGNGGTATKEIAINAQGCSTSSALPLQMRPQQGSCSGSLSVSISTSSPPFETGNRLSFRAKVKGAQNPDQLSYQWFINGYDQNIDDSLITWIAQEGTWTVRVVVKEGAKQAEASMTVGVTQVTVFLSQSPKDPKEGDTITFTATVSGGVGELSYAWFADGKATSATASSVNWSNASAGRHNIRVRVTDSEGRWGDSGIDFSVTTPADSPQAPQLTINDQPIKPGETTTITLNPGEQAELKLACENLEAAITLVVMQYNLDARNEDEEREGVLVALFDIFWRQGEGDVFRALDICSRLGPTLPASNANLQSPRQQQADGPLMLGVKFAQGGVEFDLQQEGFALQVETDTTTVTASDQDTFTVFHDPNTQQTTVAAGQGTVAVQPHASGASTVSLKAGEQVEVGTGGSGPVTPVDRGAPPPSDGSLTIPQALDANRNGLLDDAEVRTAVQLWITGQSVPGAGRTIDDAMMRQLVQMWITGQSVAQNAQAQAVWQQALSVQSLAWKTLSEWERTLIVTEQGIADVELRVFDLGGMPVLVRRGGPALRVALRGEAGRPLANGVYLYVVTVRGPGGAAWRSGLRKLVVMR